MFLSQFILEVGQQHVCPSVGWYDVNESPLINEANSFGNLQQHKCRNTCKFWANSKIKSCQWHLEWLTGSKVKCTTVFRLPFSSYLTWQMWKDKSQRFIPKHHLFYTVAWCTDKNLLNVDIQTGATAQKWSTRHLQTCKLHIQYPTHSNKKQAVLAAKQRPHYPRNTQLHPKNHHQHRKISVLFFTSQCVVCCEDSWYQPLLLVLDVPCRSMVQRRIAAAGIDWRNRLCSPFTIA